MARMRKAGTVRGSFKTRVVIPKKLELERQIIETFGVETRYCLPDLYDPQERLSNTYKHNQLGQMLMTPLKRFLPPVCTDPLAAYLDKWAIILIPRVSLLMLLPRLSTFVVMRMVLLV